MVVNIIYGPPGTGKTTELIRLLEEELKTVPPEQIAYVSFSKEGAEQGKKRALQQFMFSPEQFMHFRTLHSLAFKELGLRRDHVISKSNYRYFSEKMGMSFTGYYTEDLRNDDDKYLFFDELYRNNSKAALNFILDLDSAKLQYVRKNYKAFKEAFSIMDFTDMVEKFNERGKSIPVKVAFIDEAQDLTSLQWQMVWIAFSGCDRVYIAGDDDQAIYQWSGADVDYFLNLEGVVTTLKTSYRLPEKIISFSHLILDQISKRVKKEYVGTGQKGIVEMHNGLSEIQINPNDTYMFLSRNNIFLEQVEAELQKRAIVYSLKGKKSVEKTDIEIIKLYEKVRAVFNMTDEEEYKLRPHLKSHIDLKDAWYDSLNWKPAKINYIRQLIGNKTPIDVCNILVSTIHAVKGGEADHVVLMTDITRSVKKNLGKNPDSEHRAFYVGCTRAKKSLHIVLQTGALGYPIDPTAWLENEIKKETFI